MNLAGVWWHTSAQVKENSFIKVIIINIVLAENEPVRCRGWRWNGMKAIGFVSAKPDERVLSSNFASTRFLEKPTG